MNRKNKSLLKQVAITIDGKIVLAGLYKFYETVGLPLDVILHCFQQKNVIPDWVDFYTSALAAGMEHDRIISKLEEAVSDAYGKQWADEVISRLTLVSGFVRQTKIASTTSGADSAEDVASINQQTAEEVGRLDEGLKLLNDTISLLSKT